jgi:hypothetical protein
MTGLNREIAKSVQSCSKKGENIEALVKKT